MIVSAGLAFAEPCVGITLPSPMNRFEDLPKHDDRSWV